MSVRQDEKGARTLKLQKLAALREEEAKLDAILRELQTNDPALLAAMEEDIQEAKQVPGRRRRKAFIFIFKKCLFLERLLSVGPTPLWSSKR